MASWLGVTRLGEGNAPLHAMAVLGRSFSREEEGNTFLLRKCGEGVLAWLRVGG